MVWVGVFLALTTSLLGFIPQKAYAAEKAWNNLDIAKKAIQNVAPIISDVKQDETSASLAVSSSNYIQKPLVTETEITPQPKPIVKAAVARQTTYKPKVAVEETPVSEPDTSVNHNFPYGYCTYYVSQRRPVYWSGNAITWLGNARASGFATGDSPQAGAILVTSEGGYTGHVAYIESVDGDQITISEMNYKGWGVVSSRTISTSYGAIRGYIY